MTSPKSGSWWLARPLNACADPALRLRQPSSSLSLKTLSSSGPDWRILKLCSFYGRASLKLPIIRRGQSWQASSLDMWTLVNLSRALVRSPSSRPTQVLLISTESPHPPTHLFNRQFCSFGVSIVVSQWATLSVLKYLFEINVTETFWQQINLLVLKLLALWGDPIPIHPILAT